jgi:hypothetical protein
MLLVGRAASGFCKTDGSNCAFGGVENDLLMDDGFYGVWCFQGFYGDTWQECYIEGGGWSPWWEVVDKDYELPVKSDRLAKLELEVTRHENWDWPAIGTKYVFGEGGLAFNQEHVLYNANSNTLRVTVKTNGDFAQMNVDSEDYSPKSGGVTFDVIAWKSMVRVVK